jgi:hypothetical protein
VTPDEEISRGGEAQRALRDRILTEAWDTVRNRLVTLLEQDQPDDKRDRLTADLRSLRRVKGYVEQVALGGRLAAQQIERERTFAERVGDRIRSVA